MSDLRELYQEVILDHNGGRGTSGMIERRRAARRATTRCAAIG